MKKITALALLILASPVFAATDNPALHLSLSIIKGEHSRDSNATSTTITINGNHLVYDQRYSGYRAGKREPVHKEAAIRNAEMIRLKALLREKRLLDSAAVMHATNGTGRYVEVTLNVRLGKRRASIKIAGMAKEIEGEKLYQNGQT